MNISIIIPVYNVEKYIKECLESIIHQMNDDMEVILIDDGSSDNSGKICDEYAEKIERIKVIHKPNEGVSVARNVGIEQAKGKFIMFLDSDDVLTENIIKDVLEAIKKDVDLYAFSFSRIDEESNDINEKNNNIQEGTYSKEKFLNRYYKLRKDFPFNLWQNVYKASIIKDNNLKFPRGKIAAEDIDFYIRYLKFVNKISFSKKPLIQYRTSRVGSVTTSLKIKAMIDIFDTCNKHFYGDDRFISKHVANLYVAFLNMIIRLKSEEDRKKVIELIDSNIIKNASRPKYVIFKIIYFLLGKEKTMRYFIKMQEKEG